MFRNKTTAQVQPTIKVEQQIRGSVNLVPFTTDTDSTAKKIAVAAATTVSAGFLFKLGQIGASALSNGIAGFIEGTKKGAKAEITQDAPARTQDAPAKK